ncbi:hypothetical protein Zmor_004399, partial [Zophobas morio]
MLIIIMRMISIQAVCEVAESVHVISDSLNLANYRVKYTFVRYSANSTERVGSALTILPRSKVFYLCACRCLEYLLRFLQGGRDLKTIIFCNTLRTAALLSSLLSKSRISHSYWNGSLLYTQRRQALQNFKEEGGVIVATDSLGRGLDFVNAQVVLFDFPRSVEEWVHRVGRTGRARSQGRILLLLLVRIIRLHLLCRKSSLFLLQEKRPSCLGPLICLSECAESGKSGRSVLPSRTASRVLLPSRNACLLLHFCGCFIPLTKGDPKYYNKRRIIEGKDGRKVVFRPMPSPFYSQESASSASIEKIQ